MALNTSIHAKIDGALAKAFDADSATVPHLHELTYSWASGTSANQADKIFKDTRAVGPTATDSLDVFAGALTDRFGDVFTIARVKAVLISASGTNTGDVALTRPSANGVPIFSAVSDAIPVRPGGMAMIVAADSTAYAVASGTADLINIVNAATSTSTYDITIVGASA